MLKNATYFVRNSDKINFFILFRSLELLIKMVFVSVQKPDLFVNFCK